MKRVLVALTYLFGATCVVIALVHIAYGPSSIPGSVPVNATMDSEDRFYASLFLGFGAALTWCARDLAQRRGVYFALLAVFFIGGLARAISALQVGPPTFYFRHFGPWSSFCRLYFFMASCGVWSCRIAIS